MTTTPLNDRIDDDELERRLRATYAAVMPLLDRPVTEPNGAATNGGSPTVVQLRHSGARPQRARFATAGVAVAIGLAAAVGLTSVLMRSDRDPAPSPGAAGAPATTGSAPLEPSPDVSNAPTTTDPAGYRILDFEWSYTVQPGDYPSTIAQRFQVPFQAFLDINHLVIGEYGFVEQWPEVGGIVTIPAGASVPAGEPDPPVVTTSPPTATTAPVDGRTVVNDGEGDDSCLPDTCSSVN